GLLTVPPPRQQPALRPFGRRVEVQLVEHFDVSGTGQRSRPEGVGDLGDLIDPSALVIDAELTCRGSGRGDGVVEPLAEERIPHSGIDPALAEHGMVHRRDQVLIGTVKRGPAVSERNLDVTVTASEDVDFETDLTGGVIEPVGRDRLQRCCREIEVGRPVLAGHPFGDDLDLAGTELSCIDIGHRASSWCRCSACPTSVSDSGGAAVRFSCPRCSPALQALPAFQALPVPGAYQALPVPGTYQALRVPGIHSPSTTS